MSIGLKQLNGYTVQVERKEDRIDILLVENEDFEGRMVIKADERKDFLTPWVQKLIENGEEAGQKGVAHLVELLNRSVLFEKGKNETGYLTSRSLNTEIFKLKKVLQDEREEAGQEKRRR